MTGESSLPKRLLELLPVLAAMVFHAITFERWLLVIPAALMLLAAVWLNISVAVSTRRAVVAGAIGLIAGIAMMMASVPPPGPMPPALTSATTGAMLGLAVVFAIGRRIHAAWSCAWLLVAFSASLESSAIANVAMIVFLAVSMICAASMAGVFNARPRVIATLGLFVALVASATFGFSVFAARLDGWLQRAIEGFFYAGNLPKVTGIGEEILIGSRSSITISRRPLFELSAQSGRLATAGDGSL